MPTVEEVKKFYDGFLDKVIEPNNRHREILQTLDTVNHNGMNVLDIGCGTGITSRHLAKRAKRVIAVDLSEVLIDYAIHETTKENISYFVADITEGFFSEKFDFIVMADVLEHIIPERLRDLFSAISKMSHESTRIYLNIPSGEVIRYLRGNYPESLQIVDEDYDIDQILMMFKETGFVPYYFRLYWSQYVEYLFCTEAALNKQFGIAFQSLKKE
ncbi:MAG: class I SAM-dependent methyltransferase [Candidatus Omnitrophota bacterium]